MATTLNLSPIANRSEPIMAAALFAIIAILLIPMPGWALDLFLALNLAMTVLLLLTTLGAKQPLDFAVFPSMLLLLTLFRLTLNVSTTRAILLHGQAGAIVHAFGNYVVQGNLLVGLVVFAILVIIQFIVVTKGAGRISEVAARFILDAMPGKQMAIDAELNAGAIDEPTARKRREHLMREAEFHGAMDGASKFVRGDAIAGLIITAINLVGGVIMGLLAGISFGEAAQTYSVLTIGDSLVSQLPAFIIALASGILVTKATSQQSLAQEIGSQVKRNPQPLTISAVVLVCLALVPGLPKLPFFGLAIGLWTLARIVRQQAAADVAETTKPQETLALTPADRAAEAEKQIARDFLQTDRVGVGIGAKLIPLAKSDSGSVLVDRVVKLRGELAKKNGIWVPPIHIQDNMTLEPEAYRFFVNGREVARGEIRVGSLLALATGEPLFALSGEATNEPAFGLPAIWIAENDKARAELAGYYVTDAVGVMITHLSETLRKHAAELLGREDLKQLLDKVKATSPTLVDELIPSVVSMGLLHRVLTLLLEENVPISNLTRILESLANQPPTMKDPVELAERVRLDLGRIICDRFRDAQGLVNAIVFDPRLAVELRRSLQDKGPALDPLRFEKLVVCLGNAWRTAQVAGKEVALVTDSVLRRAMRQALARSLPDLSVISVQELPTGFGLNATTMIRPEDLQG